MPLKKIVLPHSGHKLKRQRFRCSIYDAQGEGPRFLSRVEKKKFDAASCFAPDVRGFFRLVKLITVRTGTSFI